MKLSIPMMVKNESKYLREVLESLKPIMDEVECELIIVDTGSEDNTVEIAKEYTENVYFHEWNDNFSEMRNITLGYATGEWILIIDGDEVLRNQKALIDFLQNNNLQRKNNTGLLRIKNIMDENDETSSSILSAPRLFKNRDDFSFEGAIHNQPKHIPPHIELDMTLVHYGYLSTDKALMERKFQRTSKILLGELEKAPDNIYYHYQLSVTYAMHLDHDLAVKPAEKAYELVRKKKLKMKDHMYVILQLINAYSNNKQYVKADRICHEALKISDKYIDVFYMAGKLNNHFHKYEESQKCFERYLELLKKDEELVGTKDISVINYTLGKADEVYHDLVVLSTRADEHEEAYKHFLEIKSEKFQEKLWRTMVGVWVKLDKIETIRTYYQEHVQTLEDIKIQTFEMHIENEKLKLDRDKKVAIMQEFVKVAGDYSLLNRVQLSEMTNERNDIETLKHLIESVTMTDKPIFYGDLIYFMLKHRFSVNELFKNTKAAKIRPYLDYVVKRYEDFHMIVLEFIKTPEAHDLCELRIRKELEKYALVSDKYDEADYAYMFKRFVEDGLEYVARVYNPSLIEQEIIADIKEDEEVFFLYLSKAYMYKDSNPVQYIRYLKKALSTYPLAKGIEILQKEVEPKQDESNNELETLKLKFKENIQLLIQQNMLDEAEEMVKQYEQFSSDDVQLLLFKSQIAIMKNKLSKSETTH